MIQRLMLYVTLGLVIDAAEVPSLGWIWWCIMALFLAADWIGQREGYERAHVDLEREIREAAQAMTEATRLLQTARQQLDQESNK
jgi:hypothetical protein